MVQEYKEDKETCKFLEDKMVAFIYEPFQEYVSLKVLMQNTLTTVFKLPTGAGKSFVATIVAEQYRKLGLKVAIVTTKSYLVDQLDDLLGPLRH